MNIVFFGSGAFGLPTLARLRADHRLMGIVTQPDRPAGRGVRPTPTPVAEWASVNAAGVPVFKPERASDGPRADEIRGAGADAWVVIAFGQKLSPALLAGRFAVNLHASLLPRWRGAAPINAAILAGDLVTGNSVITLADRMDAGLVLAQSRREVGPSQTAGDLHDLLAGDGAALVESVLAAHAAGRLEAAPQDDAAATAAPKLSRADGWVDFGQGADVCRRRVNGLSPWPGVTVLAAGHGVRLLRAGGAAWSGPAGEPGTLVEPGAGLVACGDGVLRLLEVQPPGKRPMRWADFARGRRIGAGEKIVGGPPGC